MEMSAMMSQEPIKTCLEEYSTLTHRGFSCEILAESLKRLNQTVAAIGNMPLTFNDYTLSEMDQSWRMDKIADDLKYGLDPNPNAHFSPHNLARVSRELATLGYKNSQVYHLWFHKLDSMLSRPSLK